MPYSRPGKMFRVAAATKLTVHGAACVESNIPGVMVKQHVAPFGTGPASAAALTQVQIGEECTILSKGIVEVAVGSLTPAVGDPVYIIAASNALSSTNTNPKFGRVVEIAGTRGCRTGFVRIDLDHKATM